MKKTLIAILLLLCCEYGFSQQQLMIHRNEKGLYLAHTVAPKESYYSVGRIYSISPKDIAAFNSLDMNAGLNVGQVLHIPLTAANFSQSRNTGTPVYYVVGEKEGLYRVSQRNGNVLMADLRKWNKLPNDALNVGQKLVVGFIDYNPSSAAVENAVVRTEPVIEKPKAKEAVVIQEPAEEKRPVVQAPPVNANNPARTAVNDGSGGYFKKQFEQQNNSRNAGKELGVTTGIFKTASGWQDGKYYALVDGVDPGTIIRITNPANNRSIYAKVLGGMSGIRQNQGYDVRISNAAASVLEIGDTEKFNARITY